MNIFVGNLNYEFRDNDLEQLFAPFGEINSVKVITDKFTGRSKGFGFVEMPKDDQASKAIDSLDGKEIRGRNIKVNKALPPKKKENNSRW
ncbi:MAG: RNA-binding protein [Chitinophagaceae bacterium]|jgi:RNA recognition motif-containing protein|nr:MAG: RNA-binding protein [Chitinophagaceae bacterium]